MEKIKTLDQIIDHFVSDPKEPLVGEYFKQLSDIQLMIQSEIGESIMGLERVGRGRKENLEIFIRRLSDLLYDVEEYYYQSNLDKTLIAKR